MCAIHRSASSLIEARSQRVQVLGHVAKPGQYALDGTNNRLTDILAMAGGRTAEGSDVVVVTRRVGPAQRFEVDVAGMYRDGDLSRDLGLEAGDVVYVPAAPVFYVYGAVQRAGVYRLAPDTSVRAALSIGGGLTPARLAARHQHQPAHARRLDARAARAARR